MAWADPRVGIDLADARNAFVGVDQNDDVVLRGRTSLTVKAGIEEDVGFDACNFHGSAGSGDHDTMLALPVKCLRTRRS